MSGLPSRGIPASASCPALADIDSHPASRVLPFLYLGNSKDAADLTCLQDLGTTCVLNVTSQLPGYHEACGITYKQIPASDSGHQNLKQYFEEAFEFIGESSRGMIIAPAMRKRDAYGPICFDILCKRIDSRNTPFPGIFMFQVSIMYP